MPLTARRRAASWIGGHLIFHDGSSQAQKQSTPASSMWTSSLNPIRW
jgi:hypothetical protein